MYAVDAHSHKCAPGDAAESQYMPLIMTRLAKEQSGGFEHSSPRIATKLDLLSHI